MEKLKKVSFLLMLVIFMAIGGCVQTGPTPPPTENTSASKDVIKLSEVEKVFVALEYEGENAPSIKDDLVTAVMQSSGWSVIKDKKSAEANIILRLYPAKDILSEFTKVSCFKKMTLLVERNGEIILSYSVDFYGPGESASNIMYRVKSTLNAVK